MLCVVASAAIGLGFATNFLIKVIRKRRDKRATAKAIDNF
jgi:hypothetical protein